MQTNIINKALDLYSLTMMQVFQGDETAAFFCLDLNVKEVIVSQKLHHMELAGPSSCLVPEMIIPKNTEATKPIILPFGIAGAWHSGERLNILIMFPKGKNRVGKKGGMVMNGEDNRSMPSQASAIVSLLLNKNVYKYDGGELLFPNVGYSTLPALTITRHWYHSYLCSQ